MILHLKTIHLIIKFNKIFFKNLIPLNKNLKKIKNYISIIEY